MTEKLSTGTQRATPHKPSFAQDFGFSSSVSECVDPAAVFLCPLAESKIPASSGSEGQSDSGKGRSWSPAWGTRVSAHVCVCREPPSRAAPLLRLRASPGPGPTNKAGSAVPLSRGVSAPQSPDPLGRVRGAPSGSCVGLWCSLSLVPAPREPRGDVEGQVCISPCELWGSERRTALCSARESGRSLFFLPRPTRDGLPSGQKANYALRAAGLGAAARPPGRRLGRTGRNSRPGCGVSQPSPGARLSVPRGERAGVHTRVRPRTPPKGQCGASAPHFSNLTPIFGVYLQTPCGSAQPRSPAGARALFPWLPRRPGWLGAAVGPLPRCRDPVNKSAGGRHLRR